MADVLKPLEDEEPPPPLRTRGLTYIAVGLNDEVALLDTDCDALAHEAQECGGAMDAGLDYPTGFEAGIWKAVVRLHAYRTPWEGDVDVSWRPEDDWVEVDSYPEPPCAMEQDGGCDGMRMPRGEGGPWACDAHAGRVA